MVRGGHAHAGNFDVIVVREVGTASLVGAWASGSLSVWAVFLFLETVKPVGIPILQMKTMRL